ncbi:hypothetical protein PoB_004369900 [Plakobranchus ocellatus]|uniref:Uncharacterized protein n=1 Tax=Plakobranchus ocellatus TaxID=259542 RepID=A0AAV4BAM7_9GAST|nr:hypothetical protein PoB_004369900 [Plakobranchus ocellatus]
MDDKKLTHCEDLIIYLERDMLSTAWGNTERGNDTFFWTRKSSGVTRQNDSHARQTLESTGGRQKHSRVCVAWCSVLHRPAQARSVLVYYTSFHGLGQPSETRPCYVRSCPSPLCT